MDAFLRWPGSKRRELNRINENLPSFSGRLIEPFIGGGSLFLNHERPGCINDLDKELFSLWNLNSLDTSDFVEQCIHFEGVRANILNADISLGMDHDDLHKLMPDVSQYSLERALNGKRKLLSKRDVTSPLEIIRTACFTAHYYDVRKRYNTLKRIGELSPELIAHFFFMREFSFSSMFRTSKNGDFNVPYGGASYNKKSLYLHLHRFLFYKNSDFHKKTVVCNLDFEDFLKQIEPNENDFIFLDPPYDSAFSDYGVPGFNLESQKRLADFMKTSKAPFMAVMKETPTIRELWRSPSFKTITYDMQYMTNMKNRNNKNVQHIMVTNY